MKKQTLWKRIFGQKSDKKVKAQHAFQEQFDTKLRFRELEPRVVLAADINYNVGTDTLTITYDADGGEVTVGRDVAGKLVLGGDLGTVTGWTDGSIYSVTNLFAYDDVNAVSTTPSTLTLLDSLDDTAHGKSFVTGLTELVNVDQFTISDNADVNLGNFAFTSNVDDADANQLDLLGTMRTSETRFRVFATSDQTTVVNDADITETQVGQLISTGIFQAFEDNTAGGKLSIDMSRGAHTVDYISANQDDVELMFKSDGTLTLNDVNATSLYLETVMGDINLDTGFKIQQTDALGSATFIAGTGGNIDITESGSSFAGSINLTGNDVALTATGSTIQLDQVDVGNDLTLVSASDVTQVLGSSIDVDGATSLSLQSGGSVNLLTGTNDFAGEVEVDGTVANLKSFHLSNDNATPLLGTNLLGRFASGAMTNVSLVFANDASFDLPAIDILGDLFVSVGGDLSDQSGKQIVVGNIASFAATNINLTNHLPGHDFEKLTLNATANASVTETDGFTFAGISNITGDLVVTSGGAIVDQADTELTVGNLANLTGTQIDLTNTTAVTGHALNLVTLVTTGTDPNDNASLLELDGFTFAGVNTILGNLTVTSGGEILDQTDTELSVGDLVSLTGTQIDLTNTTAVTGHALNLVTLVTTGTNPNDNASLLELDGFTFAGVNTILGNLTVTSGGEILDQADTELSVGDLASLTGTQIDLTNTTAVTGHALNLVTLVTTGTDPNDNASLLELDGFTFAGVNTILGSLTVTSGGEILDQADTELSVGDLASLTGTQIDLTNTTAVTGHALNLVTLVTTGTDPNDNASLLELDGFTFAGVNTILGNLTVTSGGEILDQTDTELSVGDLASLTGTQIDLANTTAVTGHALNLVTLVTTGTDPNDNASLLELDGFTFAGVSTILGNLIVTSGGEISDQADTELSIGDLANLTGTQIDLTNTTAVTGHSLNLVTLVTTGTDPNDNASLLELDGFTFAGVSTILGNLIVTSGGEISDQADTELSVGDLANLTGTQIDLTNTTAVTGHSLNLVTLVTTGTDPNDNASLLELDGFTFAGVNTILGNLTVTSGGEISDQADTELSVSDLASLTGSQIDLANTTAVSGHALNLVTLVTTGTDPNDNASLLELDGFTFAVVNTILGSLTVTSGGGILDQTDTELSVGDLASLTGTQIDLTNTTAVTGHALNLVTLVTTGTDPNDNASLLELDGFTFAGVNTILGSLTVTSGGEILDQTDTELSVGDLASLTGTQIDLDNTTAVTGHALNLVTLVTTGTDPNDNASLLELDGFTFAGVNTILGNLTVTSGGEISDQNDTELSVGDLASLTGTQIDLTNTTAVTGHALNLVTLVTTGTDPNDNASLLELDGFTFAGVNTILGNLMVTSGGEILDQADTELSVGDLASLTGTQIDLDNTTAVTGHALNLVTLVTTGTDPNDNASLLELDGFTFAGVNTILGNLTVTSGGEISDQNDTELSVGDLASLTGTQIDLTNTTAVTGHALNLVTLVTTGTDPNDNASLLELDGFTFAGVNTILGNLTVTSGGEILDQADTELSVGDLASLTGTQIDLTNTTAVTGHALNLVTLVTTGTDPNDNASLLELDGFTFAGVNTILGNLTVTSGGEISDQADTELTVNDLASFTGTQIDLDNTTAVVGHSLNMVSFVTTGTDPNDNVSLAELDGFTFAGVNTFLGSLTVTSGGAIVDQADTELSVGDLASLTGTQIDLTNTTAVTGHSLNLVTLVTTGTDPNDNASLLELDGFTFAGVNTILGNLTVTSGGEILDQTDTELSVGDLASLMGTQIDLDNTTAVTGHALNLVTLVTTGTDPNDNASLLELDGFTFAGVNTILGNLTVTSGGEILDQTDTELSVGDLASLTGTQIDLTNTTAVTGHALNLVTLVTTGTDPNDHASLLELDGFTFAGVNTILGNLTVTSGGEILDQTDTELSVGDLASLTGTQIDLDNTTAVTGHALNLVTLVTTGTDPNDNASLLELDGFTFAGVNTILGNLMVTSGGEILDQADTELSVGDLASLTGTQIDLTNTTAVTGHSLNLVTLVTTGTDPNDNASLLELDGFTFAGVNTILGNLMVTSGGEILDQADTELSVGDLASLTGTQIDLTNTTAVTGHALNLVTLVTTGTDPNDNASLLELDGFTFAGVNTILGNLTVTSGGEILDQTDTELSVGDLASLTGTQIDLDNTTAVTGHALNLVTLVTTGTDPNDNASLLELDGFTFAGVNTILGNLTVTSGGEILDQTDTELSVGDLASLTGTQIDLTNTTAVTGHALNLVTLVTTGTDPNDNASLLELDGFTFAGVNMILGNLTVTSGGEILDQADTELSVGDLASLTGTQIDLTNTTAVTGHALNLVTLVTTGTDPNDNASLLELDGFTFAGVNTILGNLTVTSGGAIVDQTNTKLTVNDLTDLKGTAIDLANTTAVTGHSLNQVTFVTTAGDAELKELDGFEFVGANDIQGGLTVTTGGGITQPNGTLTVTGITNLTVGEGELVTLDKMNDFQGTVSIKGATNRAGDVTLVDINAIEFGDVVSNKLKITAGGNITQDTGTHLDILTQTILGLSSKATIELLNVGNDLSTDVQLDTAGNIDRVWDFEIRNENAGGIVVPGGDFENVVKGGMVDDLTLEFVNAPTLTLPEIKITDDLRIVIAGLLTQSGDIEAGDTAQFDAGTITLANANSLTVANNASFTVDTGDLNVGVTPTTAADKDRGTVAPATVNLGTLTFSADGHNVTISENSAMNLAGDNVAQTVYLRSENASIETNADATLDVNDLAAFRAFTDISLGNATNSEVDLRILLVDAGGSVSIIENSDFSSMTDTETALAVMNGTTVTGTLAIQTGGHIIQVNDIRTAGPGDRIQAGFALFDSEGSILLTDLEVGRIAASAGGTPLFVTQGVGLDFDAAGINKGNGFGGDLATAVIDSSLPTENADTFADNARADAFLFQDVDGNMIDDGEAYSIIISDIDGLVIGSVADAIAGGKVPLIDGLRTNGAEAGHVFVRAEGGNLTFGTGAGLVVGLANSGVITALASGDLTITPGSWLHVTDGADPVASAFAVVTTIEGFVDNPTNKFELPNSTTVAMPNEGPAYSRIPGNVDTYVLGTQTGKDSTATIVLNKLGTLGAPDEMDFEVVLNFNDTTPPQLEPYPVAFNSDTVILHDIPWEFATTNASTVVTLQAYNSPNINLYADVAADESSFNNLNVVIDQFEIFFLTPIDYVPEMSNFAAPNNPYLTPIIVPEPEVAPYAALTEIADDTRVATQIDGVTVVEVDPSDFMEIGEEIELDDDFMTLDAVKEFIQNGDQFPPGLYKIEILYPGAEVPEEHFYWKQDRPDPFDLFSRSSKPVAPQAAELAAADQAKAQLSAEEVWAREYEKWFPTAADMQPADDLLVPSAEGESGDMIPSEDDILLERVTTVSLQEIDRMTDRLRAKRSIVRDSLNGAMIGGAALMAAVAAQGRRDDEAPNHHPDEQREQPEDSLDETSLGRLRRRVRQWL
ncbi:ATP1G1/PLM/MAT8 family protein [Bremerella volcania]|uniref:ATP1G1/PLM/MAT8 family protein n=1 Tax=Bremerella volcania TaxID=2527984 RepID=A0A518C3M3_9BACT|nr:hypothetical protein [Bremerella volcania]QDU73823.1 ATP1G1/PLM/MAT8 family protein [Bremerella volcania]